MSGFTNADGSTLVGGQKPSGQGQALQVDTSGNLLVNVAVGGGGGAGSTVNIADPTTPANKMSDPGMDCEWTGFYGHDRQAYGGRSDYWRAQCLQSKRKRQDAHHFQPGLRYREQ